jgi:chromosome segregation ATPase
MGDEFDYENMDGAIGEVGGSEDPMGELNAGSMVLDGPEGQDPGPLGFGDPGDLGQGSVEDFGDGLADMNLDPEAEGELDDEEESDELAGVDDLPLFANAEARQLHLNIKERDENISSVSEQIADMTERLKVMKEHFRNVQQEVEHTNALYGAKKKEIETEVHLQQLTTRSLAGAKKEGQEVSSKLEDLRDGLNAIQNDIYTNNQTLDEFKMQMNWNQDELEQWSLAASQKEEDAQALEKYTRQDDLKIKELTLKLEHLTKESHNLAVMVTNEQANTVAKERELDRVAKDFQEMHEDRQKVVSRWQETIVEMRNRDVAINELGLHYADAKRVRVEKERQVAEYEKRMQKQIKENKEVEARSEILSRLVSRKREEMMQNTNNITNFRDELESLKSELGAAAEAIVMNRASNQHVSKESEERKVALERQRSKYKKVKRQVEEERSATDSAEKTAKGAEKELEAKEKEFMQAILRVKELKDVLLKEQQTVFETRKEEAGMRQTIQGSKSTNRNLEQKLHQLDKEAARQQELLYNAEFQIQQVERKIARGMGERSDEEKRSLKATIEDLEGKRQAIGEKRKMLQQQVRKLTNELTNGKLTKERLEVKQKELKEAQSAGQLEVRLLNDDIAAKTRTKEDQAVQNDLLRLEVRRLTDLLSAKSDAVFSLENRRQQLMLSLEERKEEIGVHRDVLKAELRTVQDERHKVTMELRDRESKVEKLKARYVAQNSSKDGEEQHSQAYYVIQAAQNREELQRRGDELNHDVQRAERDIRALQTTLDHLNARNNVFRDSFRKVDPKGEDSDVLRQMEQRAKLAKDQLFRSKKELQRLITDLEEDQRRLLQVKQQGSRANAQREHLDSARAHVEEELLALDAQLDEMNDRVVKITRKSRKAAAERAHVSAEMFSAGTLEEKAAKAEVTKDCVQNVLYTLGQLAREFPEVQEVLGGQLEDAGLKMPARPPSARIPGSLAPSPSPGGQQFDIELP